MSARDVLAGQWRERFIGPRRRALLGSNDAAVDRGAIPAPDRALVADLTFGPLWYRLLVGHGPLDDAHADTLARAVALLARGGGGTIGP